MRAAVIGARYAEERTLAIAELLLAGAEVNAASSCDNKTLLEVVEQRGHLKLRQLLLAKGAKRGRP